MRQPMPIPPWEMQSRAGQRGLATKDPFGYIGHSLDALHPHHGGQEGHREGKGRGKGPKQHTFSMPAVKALSDIVHSHLKNGTVGVPEGLDAWIAQVAVLRTKFDASEAPFDRRPRDLRWPAALSGDLGEAVRGVGEDSREVTKQLHKWLDALKKIRSRMGGFLKNERLLKGVVQSLMAANGITDRPPPPATPLSPETLEVITVHCNEDVFEFLCTRGVSAIMLKNEKQLQAILPYILVQYPNCDMTTHSWVEAMVAVGGNATPHSGSLQALVKQMHRAVPEKLMYLFKEAMGIERARRKKVLADQREPALEHGAPAAHRDTAPPSGVKVAAPALLVPMNTY